MAGYIGSKAVITSGISASIDELNLIDGVTATTAELNILDGVTSTAAELNILDGVTSTAAELNILDGVTSTAAELNILDGVTATAAELNLIDGGTGRGTTAVADGDGFLTNDGGTMRMTKVDTLATYMGTKIGGGGTEFIASSGAISDGTASVAFTGFDASKYDHYIFMFQHLIPATDGGGNYILGRLSANGGGAYDATNGNYHYSASTDRTGFLIINEAIGNDTNEYGFSGEFKVFCPHVAAYTYSRQVGVGMTTDSGNVASATGGSIHLSAAAQNAIQFLFNSGNIESGEITMFGVINS